MVETISITDPTDPRIAAFREVRERDLVGREGLFIAEGEVVLRHLVRSRRHEPLAVLLAQKRAEALAEMLADLPSGVPVYTAGQDVLDAIAGFHIHRGILALGRRAPEPDAAALLAGLPERALVLVLHGIANHDNIGGIFRNAAAFGVDAVLVDATSCDPLYRKALRVSVGGVLRVPFTRIAAEVDPINLLTEAGFEPLALSPTGATDLKDLRVAGGRVAVLLGAEGPGLPGELLDRARTVAIPMASGFDSLNVAVTSGIVLHHLRA